MLELIENAKKSDQWEGVVQFLKSEEGVNVVERVEREIDVLLNRLERLKQIKKQKNRVQPYDQLQEEGHLLTHCLESKGMLVKEIEEQRKWKKRESVYENAGKRVEETIKEILEALEKVEANEELKEVPYSQEDYSPPETYYGAHLDSKEEEGGRIYHRDVYTAKWRLEKDLKEITLPKLEWSLVGEKKKIVDAGCSTGLTTDAIKRRYPQAEVIGVDLNEESLVKARKYFPKLKFVKGDFYKLSKLFHASSLAVIFMGNNFSLTMRQMKQREMKAVIVEMMTVLQEGGYWILYDTNQAVLLKKEGEKLWIEQKKCEEGEGLEKFLELCEARK